MTVILSVAGALLSIIVIASALLFGREWIRSRRERRFAEEVERHSGLSAVLRDGSPEEFREALGRLRRIGKPGIREAILDKAREGSSPENRKFLIQACEDLRAEGLPVQLIIKERIPNSEINRLMREVDIVASGFVIGYYELFAIEGMSMSKPVLNYWRPDLKLLYSEYSYASECPIIDTPVSDLKKNIRLLVGDPDLRRQLGQAGRRYVQKYHSYAAIGELFDRVIRKVWFDEPVEFSKCPAPDAREI